MERDPIREVVGSNCDVRGACKERDDLKCEVYRKNVVFVLYSRSSASSSKGVRGGEQLGRVEGQEREEEGGWWWKGRKEVGAKRVASFF